MKKKINIWNRVEKIAMLFAFVIAMMLIVNYFQYKTLDPVESKLIDSLVVKLNQNPNNDELREEIRNIDLLSRKAYFTQQWQIRTGGYLLLLAVVIIIISRQMMMSAEEKTVDLSESAYGFMDKKQSRLWVSAIGGLVVLAALILAFFSHQDLSTDLEKAIAQEEMIQEVQKESKPELVNSTTQKTTDKPIQEKEKAEEQVTTKPKKEEVIEEAPPKKEIVENQEAQVKKEITPKEQKEDKVTAQSYPSDDEFKANFPAFRGFGSNGIDFHSNIPTQWDGESGENILWKTKIPLHGYNSPIIWENQLFVSGADGEKREVYSIDRNTGEILWTYDVTGVPGSPAKSPKVTDDTGLAAPSLTTDGKSVFALFGNSDLVALDLEGNLIWHQNLGPTNNHYGHSSSLITYEDVLIVQWDVKKNPRLLGFNVKNGEQIYETPRKVKISWASPVLVNTGNRMEVILVADPIVASYNPKTGEEYWQIDCIFGEVGPSVAYGSGLVYAVNEYAILVAIKPGDTPEIVWENDELLSDVPSPVVHDGLMFLATSYGVIVCYDAVSGEKYWENEFDNGFYGSPMYSDGKIYIMDMDGVVHVFKAGKTYEAVSSNPLGERGMTTPAFMDGKIYLRGNEYLYCIGK